MSVRIPDDIRGVDEANAELDRLMAADAALENPAGTVKPATESAPDNEQRAAQAGEEGTPAVKEPVVTDPKVPTEQARDPKGKFAGKEASAPGEKSRYAKAVERQEKSWSELNAQKEVLKREREEFDRVKSEHEAAKAKAAADFSPEAYEDAAKRFQEQGKFDLAELAKEKAAQLRKNPKPETRNPNTAANADALEPQRKEWALKAGVDFPEVAKTNSAMQVRVAQLLNEEPDLKAHPKGIYMAARIADLESRSAGVPAKDKELAELRAKVKHYEGLTAPGEGGATALPAAKTFEQLSDSEQYEQLQREAQEVGNLR